MWAKLVKCVGKVCWCSGRMWVKWEGKVCGWSGRVLVGKVYGCSVDG